MGGRYFWEPSFSQGLCDKLSFLMQPRVELSFKIRCGDRQVVWEFGTAWFRYGKLQPACKAQLEAPVAPTAGGLIEAVLKNDVCLLTFDLGSVRRTSLNMECPATFFAVFIGLEGKTKGSQGMGWLERSKDSSSVWGCGTSSLHLHLHSWQIQSHFFPSKLANGVLSPLSRAALAEMPELVFKIALWDLCDTWQPFENRVVLCFCVFWVTDQRRALAGCLLILECKRSWQVAFYPPENSFIFFSGNNLGYHLLSLGMCPSM